MGIVNGGWKGSSEEQLPLESCCTCLVSVSTITLECVNNYCRASYKNVTYNSSKLYWKWFQISDFFHRNINPLSALPLCLADTVLLLEKF